MANVTVFFQDLHQKLMRVFAQRIQLTLLQRPSRIPPWNLFKIPSIILDLLWIAPEITSETPPLVSSKNPRKIILQIFQENVEFISDSWIPSLQILPRFLPRPFPKTQKIISPKMSSLISKDFLQNSCLFFRKFRSRLEVVLENPPIISSIRLSEFFDSIHASRISENPLTSEEVLKLFLYEFLG